MNSSIAGNPDFEEKSGCSVFDPVSSSWTVQLGVAGLRGLMWSDCLVWQLSDNNSVSEFEFFGVQKSFIESAFDQKSHFSSRLNSFDLQDNFLSIVFVVP